MTEHDAKKYTDEQVWRVLLADVEKYRAGPSIDVKDAEQQVAKAKERIRLGVHSEYPGVQYLTLARALALANRREE